MLSGIEFCYFSSGVTEDSAVLGCEAVPLGNWIPGVICFWKHKIY